MSDETNTAKDPNENKPDADKDAQGSNDTKTSQSNGADTSDTKAADKDDKGDKGDKDNKDDKSTKKPAASKAKPKKDDSVWFQTREFESIEFDICGIRAIRANDGRLRWRVPKDKADRFERHHHVKTGRVIKLDKAPEDAQ